MKLIYAQTPSKASPILILPYEEDKLDIERLDRMVGRNVGLDFAGKFKENQLLYPPRGNQKVYLLGLGKKENQANGALAFRSLVHQHQLYQAKEVVLDLRHLNASWAYEAILGWQLAAYHPGATDKTQDPPQGLLTESLILIHGDKEVLDHARRGQVTGDTQSRIMQLVDQPANLKSPEFLAEFALDSAQRFGYEATIMDEAALEQAGMAAVLAVGKGSEFPPRMIQLIYRPTGHTTRRPALGLVGKGITFDTGGISLKRPSNMHFMKSDMGGAAAVLGAIELAARLELPIYVVGLIPTAENAVGARSFRPSDVIPSYSGKSIEIIDTDAEGRLVLADGLAYMIDRHKPERLIDLATLTGSCVQTLGYSAAGLFTHDDKLAAQLSRAGNAVHERVWRLPLYADFEDDLQSDVADIKNFSGKPVAGAITAAKFLEAFVDKHAHWAHLDIAGVAFGDSEFTRMKAATGYGVRLLVQYMQTLIPSRK